MKDKKLLSVIYTSLTQDAASKVIILLTSRNTWTTLEAVYSSASCQHQLCEELISLRRGESSVEDYGKKFKSLCDQLSAICHPVEESDKSYWFFRGLGVQFASFADTRMAFTSIPCFRDLLNQAKQYHLMLRCIEGSVSQAAFTIDHSRNLNYGSLHSRGSNYGGQSNSDRQSSQGQSYGRGSGFGQGQNSGRGSFFEGQQGGGSNNSNNGGRRTYIPRYQICRGEHYADKCPQFLYARNAMLSAKLAHAFFSSCNVSDSTPNWYIDSGASAHMTNQATASSLILVMVKSLLVMSTL